MFEQFVRLENNGTGGAGRGLGLSIVEKIDTALDLGLQMTSTLGEGTQFTFHVPIAREHK